MKKLHPFLYCLILLFNCACNDAQSSFPLVTVPDANATIPNTVSKAYITTLQLNPVSPNSQFVEATFLAAAEPFYSTTAGIPGYIGISDVTFVSVNANFGLVTYTVRYNLEVLRINNVNDNQITSSIGNYPLLQNTIGSVQNQLISFYTIPESDANFVFTGSSVCDQPGVACSGAEVMCTEVLNGVSVTCVSPCKLGFCQNNGTCAQTSENASPTCSCLSTSDVWFIGSRCELTVALWMVIVTIVGCIILIIVVIVLACCFYRKRVKRKRKETDFAQPATYKNYAFTPEENKQPVENTTPITRGGYGNGRLEARNEPEVFRSRSYEESDHTRRRRRRSYDSDHKDRRRRDSHLHSDSSRQSSEVSSASSVSSDSFDSLHDGASDNKTQTPNSSIRSPSSLAHPPSSSYSTVIGEFGNDPTNDVDLQTRDQGTSPIRWYPTSQTPQPMPQNKMGKVNIADRKGWLPSLGPQMFNLDIASTDNQNPVIPDTDI